MSTLKFDPELLVANPAFTKRPLPGFAPPQDVPAFRKINNEILTQLYSAIPYPPNVEESKHTAIGQDGTEIAITRFGTAAQRNATSGSPQPALVWIHGGGLVFGGVDLQRSKIAAHVDDWGVQMFAVDYRLAPEHRAPAAAEDCYAAIKWLSENAVELGVDPARIAIVGESAGGGIAAGTALLARDRGLSPPLAKQFLFYPMLDDRTSEKFKPDDPLLDFVIWSPETNKFGWSAYLGEDKAGNPEVDVSPYAAPARAQSLAGLPSTYIDVSGLDIFCTENIEYAAGLSAARVEVEIHVYAGLPHGFDIQRGLSAVERAAENRIRVMKTL